MSYRIDFKLLLAPIACTLLAGCSKTGTATQFCLDGEFDLGSRYQGMHAAAGEMYPTSFCYVIDHGSDSVLFKARGKSNPDMDGDWTVAFLSPDRVRIINRASPPDIEFSGKNIIDEAGRYRRSDPKHLLAELVVNPDWVIGRSDDGWITVQYPGSTNHAELLIVNDKLAEVRTQADIPLRGRVAVTWRWNWSELQAPRLELFVEGNIVFGATASWETLDAAETKKLWALSGGQEPVQVSGDRWPARIDLDTEKIAENVHLVTGVRTGFAHIVIETTAGLVVGDAPAGWVELQQLPPADLVPGYSISPLSENFVDYLNAQFPDTPIHAVALTHAHDDHAGGARAFAAAGAKVYAPEGVAAFLSEALNLEQMPDDRLSALDGSVTVLPVTDRLTLGDDEVELIVLPGGPHVDTSLGILAKAAGVFYQSDLHVPRSDDDSPRTDRAVTECWFAAWAIANLPADANVINSHTPPRTPVSRLAKYLQSETCRRL